MKSRNANLNIADENLRGAVECCPIGIVMIDRGGTILLVNAESERLLQYRRDALIGKPVEILIPPRYRDEFPKFQKAFCERPQSLPAEKGGEFFALRKDGSELPIEIRLNQVPMDDGSTAIVATIADISERNLSDKNKDEFVAMVSHELRTPLTSIAASLGLLVADSTGRLSDAAKRLLRIAHGNSQRLVRLINDILDIEKIESGKVEFHMRRIDLRPLIEQAIDGNRAFADQFEVAVRFDSKSIDAVVRTDFDRLMQVVTNLLSNAVKFSPRGGEVLVSIASVGDSTRIAVRDSGPGIPAEFQSRIFEKFAQAVSVDGHQKGGTGLGLSIVKEIVVWLGGETGFESAPGGGTIFYVDLPSYEQGAEDAEGAHILLCVDEPCAGPLLCNKLHDAGFDVDVAFSADEAVRGSATRTYAAIVIDLQLPDSNGITLIKQLRTQWHYRNRPMIVVSADPNFAQSDSPAAILNALDWLSKPLDVERLVRILNRPIIRDMYRRPHILHFDGDRNVLQLVAEALKTNCELYSADTTEQARRTLSERNIDFAIIELNSARAASGLDLLPDLRDESGHPIPVVMYSASDRSEIAASVVASLTKSRISINGLVTTLRRLVTGKTSIAKIKEVA